MSAVERVSRRAFTLIELLVVVAIIALLISILLPSLKCAREKARAAKCGVTLRSFGSGMNAYATEFNDWLPGVNTTGIEVAVALLRGDKNALRRASMPVQNYDWMSPLVRYETELGNNRAERFRTLINEYRCPTFDGLSIDQPYPPNPNSMPDGADFTKEIILSYAPLSYLMPAHFQWWGRGYAGAAAAWYYSGVRTYPIAAKTPGGDFSARHTGRYQSRLSMVGPPSHKIAVADGMRYMTADGNIDFDVSPGPTWFGAFTSNGAWWAGSQAYGVREGSINWDGTAVHTDTGGPDAQGRALVWSYRHGCSSRDKITEGVRDNNGEINALFFDGHVAMLNDRASRQVEYWYPTGTYAWPNSGGLTDVVPDTVDPVSGDQVYEVP